MNYLLIVGLYIKRIQCIAVFYASKKCNATREDLVQLLMYEAYGAGAAVKNNINRLDQTSHILRRLIKCILLSRKKGQDFAVCKEK